MLVGYEGSLGSGKSYTVIRDVFLKMLKNASKDYNELRHVYTNIDGIDSDSCIEAQSLYSGLSISDIKSILHVVPDAWFQNISENCPDGALVIVDEAHRVWCSREWKNFPEASRNFIAESRHHSVDIVYISQKVNSVDSWIVQRTEIVYSALKLSSLGMSNKYALRQRTGESKKNNLKPSIHTYNKKVFACYKSFHNGDFAIQTVGGKLLGKSTIFFLVLLPVIIYYAYDHFTSKFEEERLVPPIVEHVVIKDSVVAPSSLNVGFSQQSADAYQHKIRNEKTLYVSGIFCSSSFAELFLSDGDYRNVPSDSLGLPVRSCKVDPVTGRVTALSYGGELFTMNSPYDVPPGKLKYLSPYRSTIDPYSNRSNSSPVPG